MASAAEVPFGEESLRIAYLSRDEGDAKADVVPWCEAHDVLALVGVGGVPSAALRNFGDLPYAQHHQQGKNNTVWITMELTLRFLNHHGFSMPRLLTGFASALCRPFAAKKQVATLARQCQELSDADFDRLSSNLVPRLNHQRTTALEALLQEKKRGAYEPYPEKGSRARGDDLSAVWDCAVSRFCAPEERQELVRAESLATDASGLSQDQPSPPGSPHAQQASSPMRDSRPEPAALPAGLVEGFADLIEQRAPLTAQLMRFWHRKRGPELVKLFLTIVYPNLEADLETAAATCKAGAGISDRVWHHIFRAAFKPIQARLGIDVLPPAGRLNSRFWAALAGLRFWTTRRWPLEKLQRLGPRVANSVDQQPAESDSQVSSQHYAEASSLLSVRLVCFYNLRLPQPGD